jgi:hypothetical protein
VLSCVIKRERTRILRACKGRGSDKTKCKKLLAIVGACAQGKRMTVRAVTETKTVVHYYKGLKHKYRWGAAKHRSSRATHTRVCAHSQARGRVHLSDQHTNAMTQLGRWSPDERSQPCAERVACGSTLRTLPRGGNDSSVRTEQQSQMERLPGHRSCTIGTRNHLQVLSGEVSRSTPEVT